jgi:hypothetical protein
MLLVLWIIIHSKTQPNGIDSAISDIVFSEFANNNGEVLALKSTGQV